ncbi:hypothetical protein ACFQ07_10855 [Actinomadura adrarensis]|uniref:Uncharacterized protein n=1 Tax=Actinomadura adrarensis TaxID=1819600 RepID=A0ABW3CG66_9ACTN
MAVADESLTFAVIFLYLSRIGIPPTVDGLAGRGPFPQLCPATTGKQGNYDIKEKSV